jgi:hypothetical protein
MAAGQRQTCVEKGNPDTAQAVKIRLAEIMGEEMAGARGFELERT